MRRLLVLAALLVALPAGAVTMDWVPIGNPNNPADTPSTNCYAANCGAVADAYRISKYEVTNAQYAEFLNAKAASDPLGLYDPRMGSDAAFGGITQSGVSGSYTYTVKAGFEDKPVVYVSFYVALRFANWLNNGQGSADTETGAYLLLGGTPVPSNGLTVTRNPGAITFLTSENEWYKAAYYDPALPGYYDYPAGTDTPTMCAAPGAAGNTANCASGTLTDVGSYTGSPSPYGTFDQGGNVWEWNEQIVIGSNRGFRGGNWSYGAGSLAASNPNGYDPMYGDFDIGFRVASPVPEPTQVLLVLTGGLVLAAARRQRRAQPLSDGGLAPGRSPSTAKRGGQAVLARPAGAVRGLVAAVLGWWSRWPCLGPGSPNAGQCRGAALPSAPTHGYGTDARPPGTRSLIPFRGRWMLTPHCARHTWASFALEAGKSVRWVADVLGHADPTLTLRVYAHAMREAETDLAFLDFAASSDGAGRHYTALTPTDRDNEARNAAESLARREGLEPPTLRFEASRRSPKRLRNRPRIPLRAVRSRSRGVRRHPMGTHAAGRRGLGKVTVACWYARWM